MKKEVSFILLNEYADWEGVFLAPALNAGVQPERPVKYMVKTLSATGISSPRTVLAILNSPLKKVISLIKSFFAA